MDFDFVIRFCVWYSEGIGKYDCRADVDGGFRS